MENIAIIFLLTGISGGLLSLFYNTILKLSGFSFGYVKVALVLAAIVLLPGLLYFEAGVACFIAEFIGVFVLAIGLMVWNVVSGFGARIKPNSAEDSTAQEGIVSAPVNYFPMVFHMVISVLILLTMYSSAVTPALSEQKMTALIADMAFQFNMTLLLICIGIFNPFIPPTPRMVNALVQLRDGRQSPLWEFVSRPEAVTYIKMGICVLITGYFILSGSLQFPSWRNAGILMDDAILFTGEYKLTRRS